SPPPPPPFLLPCPPRAGIVFIDEIDKLCGSSSDHPSTSVTTGGSSSSNKGEGVQRELLTLVEGCAVPTRYGSIRTDFILFIASGAFHNKSPSDLLPELQGRFPVRVTLQPLKKEDLIQILSTKKFNLLVQTVQLLATEGVEVEFTDCGVEAMAAFAQLINRTQQDVGARRLNTVMHRVLEDLSYAAPRRRGQKVVVDATFVENRLKEFDLTKQDNLSRYIL
ncbi:atp-dependent protease atp-binding subunit, partial [Nannochloropsis gaditana]